MSNKSVKMFTFHKVERKIIKDFVEKWHYSKNINGLRISYCFALKDSNEIIGAAIIGKPAMANQYKRFSDEENDVLEIRRLCCIDETPKNTESFFISKIIKWLKKNTDIKVLISYADAEYNHSGIIYRASNFKYLGFSKGAKVINWNGKKYHDKAIRTKYKGELKPFAKRLKLALQNNEAFFSETKGKHCYVYRISK